MSKMQRLVTCPKCLTQFDPKEGVSNDKKMMALLVKQGYGLREVGRIFNEHPETIKYWAEKINSRPPTTKSSKEEPKP